MAQNEMFVPTAHGLAPRFCGADFIPERDAVRLTGQLQRVYDALKSGRWMTVAEIKKVTGDPEASISAQARNLRKKVNGSHRIIARRRNDSSLYEYRMESP